MRLLLPLAALMAVFTPARGQEENWDTYMARFGAKPGSVMVDMALINRAPVKGLPYLVITGPKAQLSDKNGIPARDEISTLDDILDASTNFITGVTAKALVGTFTYNGERLNYYYVRDTAGIRVALARMYTRSFPAYNYTLKMKADPEWAAYRTFLYPDGATQIWMENDKIITRMLQQGDSLKNQRNITFDLFFPSDTDRNAVVDFAQKNNYRFERTYMSSAVPYELLLTRYDYIDIELIDSMTADLKKQTRLHHGVYNGWGVK